MAAGSNVERLRVPTPEEALIFKRSSATDSAFSIIGKGRHGQELLPQCLLDAFECEAWKDRKTPNGAAVCNADFMEWVTAPYPRGLGTTPEIVRAILTSSPEAGKAQQALLLWDRATRREGGRPTGETVDNIHSFERPSGTSAAAGLRRLDREAEKGNEIAARALEQVKAGTVSVHAAMVDCGFRKSTKIDRDVRDRAAQSLAELIVAHVPSDALDAAKGDAFACGARALGIALSNLIGGSIMDGRYR